MLGCRVADYTDRCDILPGPVQCWRSTSMRRPTQYPTTTQEHLRWLLPSSFEYSSVFSPAAGRPFSEKQISHAQVPMSECLIDSVIRGALEKANHLPRHCGNYARCVPSYRESGQAKHPANEP